VSGVTKVPRCVVWRAPHPGATARCRVVDPGGPTTPVNRPWTSRRDRPPS